MRGDSSSDDIHVSTDLLALFGCKMLYEGWQMSPEEGQEEFEEVSQELQKREEVVGVVLTLDRKLFAFCRPQQKYWYNVLHCEIPPTMVCRCSLGYT